MKNILFFDTETTGLPADFNAPYTDTENWPEIVGIAYYITDQVGESKAQSDYIVATRPGVVNGAAHINGITPEMQLEGKPIEEILSEITRAIEHWDVGTIVCHNVAFDIPVLFAEMDRIGMKPPEGIEWYCTKEQSTDLCKIPKLTGYYKNSRQYKWPSLDELHQFLFNEPIPGRETYHDAMTDVRATARCYFEMQKRFAEISGY